jgi:hypothetical protein
MILRIEIYEPLAKHEIEEIKTLIIGMGVDVTKITVEHVPEKEEPVEENYCQNCDWKGPDDELKPIRKLWERVEPGDPMPSGECPKCGALCQPVEGELQLPDRTPTEPEEGDWITNDYKQWQEYNGRKITVTDPDDWAAQMKDVMEREQWWPNLWLQGERGEWNLLDIHKGTFA